jgi:hypothetical protein
MGFTQSKEQPQYYFTMNLTCGSETEDFCPGQQALHSLETGHQLGSYLRHLFIYGNVFVKHISPPLAYLLMFLLQIFRYLKVQNHI